MIDLRSTDTNRIDSLHGQQVELKGERLLLLPNGAIFWSSEKILLVADVHMGKEHCFGRAGIPIPNGISETTLNRLFSLVDATDVNRLIILGDFIHTTPHATESWLLQLEHHLNSRPTVSVEIVVGNHDKLAGQLLLDNRLVWHAKSLFIKPFLFQHDPSQHEKGFVLGGHIHPAWRLKQSRRSSIKAPAFWFTEHFAVLPAFGDFTGGVVVDAKANTDRIYMAAENAVIEVPIS